MKKTLNYFNPERIAFLKAGTSMPGALRTLSMTSSQYLHSTDAFMLQLLKREELLSTGLGLGLAFPHVKSPDVKDFFITLGISHAGIEWDSLDSKPAHLIFLIGGIVDQQDKYLKILAALSHSLKDSSLRQKLIEAQNPQTIYRHLELLAQS